MRTQWLRAWNDRGFRICIWSGLLTGIPVIVLLPRFFALIENTPGVPLNDPVLAAIGPVEVSAITFGILYSLVHFGIFHLAREPLRFVRMLHAYVVLLLLRMITMYTVTLEPPASIIPLIDPITQLFYPAEEPFLKDLFFSGHTATLVLFAIAVGRGRSQALIGTGAVVVGFLVLLQHVHYTVDVLAAPFFATLAWVLAHATTKACRAAA